LVEATHGGDACQHTIDVPTTKTPNILDGPQNYKLVFHLLVLLVGNKMIRC
jgi:hypothetical protein